MPTDKSEKKSSDKGLNKGSTQPKIKEIFSPKLVWTDKKDNETAETTTPKQELPKKRKDITPPDPSIKPASKKANIDTMEGDEGEVARQQNVGAEGNGKEEDVTNISPKERKRKQEAKVMQDAIIAAVTRSLQESWNLTVAQIRGDINDMRRDIKVLMESKEFLRKSESEFKLVKVNQADLRMKYHNLERDNKEMKGRLAKIEDKMLENNIVIHGIAEERGERDEGRQEKIYHAMATTVRAPNPVFRLQAAKRAKIKYTRRIGTPNPNAYRPRPISVVFNKLDDAKILLQNKKNLPEGVFVNREYSDETEKTRRYLRPIFRAAQDHSAYKGQCRLDSDTLVIKGRRFTKDNIHQLPDDLSGFHVSSRTNTSTFGFFGELSPFSNFHPCRFSHNGREYHCTEQFIQREKALFFKDYDVAEEMMMTNTALECKKLSRDIRNFNYTQWAENCKGICMPGLICKFQQNKKLQSMLQSTYPKRLVESSRDTLWGTGVILYDNNCLQEELWKGTGCLGEMLMEYREILINPPKLNIPPLPEREEQRDTITEHNMETSHAPMD